MGTTKGMQCIISGSYTLLPVTNQKITEKVLESMNGWRRNEQCSTRVEIDYYF